MFVNGNRGGPGRVNPDAGNVFRFKAGLFAGFAQGLLNYFSQSCQVIKR